MKAHQISRWKLPSELYDNTYIELIPSGDNRKGPRAVLVVNGVPVELNDLHELSEVRRLCIEGVRVGKRFAGHLWKHRRERKLRMKHEIGVIEVDAATHYQRREGTDEEDEF